MIKLKNILKQHYVFIIPAAIIVLLRIPSLFQCTFFMDESIYALVASQMAHGKVLYTQIWDHKPPLIFLIFYVGYVLTTNPTADVFVVQLFNLIAAIIALYYIYKILQHFGFRKTIIFFALVAFAILVGSTIFEGNFVNAENFFIAINLAFFYRLLKNKYDLIAGFLLFLSFLIKQNVFIESLYLLFFAGLFELQKTKNLVQAILKFKRMIISFVASLVLLIATLLIAGNIVEFLKTSFIDNFKYTVDAVSFGAYPVTPNYFLIIIFILVTFIAIYLVLKRDAKERKLIVALLFIIELAMACITGRNYTHYLLQVMPSIVICSAFIFSYLNRTYGLIRGSLFLQMTAFSSILIYLVVIVIAIFIRLDLITFVGEKFIVYVSPVDYYTSFYFDNKNFTLGPNCEECTEQSSLLRQLNDKYSSKYKTFYAYVESFPLDFLYQVNMRVTNKYPLASHLGFGPEFLDDAKENLKNSDMVIVYKETAMYDKFLSAVEENFKLSDTIDGRFDIYTRKD